MARGCGRCHQTSKAPYMDRRKADWCIELLADFLHTSSRIEVNEKVLASVHWQLAREEFPPRRSHLAVRATNLRRILDVLRQKRQGKFDQLNSLLEELQYLDEVENKQPDEATSK